MKYISGIFLVIILIFHLIFFFVEPELSLPFTALSVSLLILYHLEKNRKLFLPSRSLLIAFFALFIAKFISSLFSSQPYLSTLNLVLFINIFLVLLLSLNIVRTLPKKISFSYFLFPILLVIVLMLLNGISDYTSLSIAQQFNLGLFTPYSWPSLITTLTLIFLPFSILKTLSSQKPTRLAFFFFSAILLISLILTKTNYYLWILEAIFLIPLLFTQLKKQSWTFLLLGLFVLSISPNLLGSFGFRSNPPQRSLFISDLAFANTQEIISHSFTLFQDKLIFGWGPGTFANVFTSIVNAPWTWSSSAKNELIQSAVETGALGFLTTAFLFLVLAITYLKIIFSPLQLPSSRMLAIGLFIALIASSTNDFSFSFIPTALLIATLTGFIVPYAKLPGKSLLFTTFPILTVATISFFLFTDTLSLRTAKRTLSQNQISQTKFIKLVNRPPLLQNPKALYWLAAEYLDNQQLSQAKDILLQSQELDPYNQEISYQLAYLAWKTHNYQQAEDILTKLISKTKFLPPKYYLLLYNLFLEQNKSREASSLANQIETLFPANSKFLDNFSLLGETPTLSSLQTFIYVSRLSP